MSQKSSRQGIRLVDGPVSDPLVSETYLNLWKVISTSSTCAYDAYPSQIAYDAYTLSILLRTGRGSNPARSGKNLNLSLEDLSRPGWIGTTILGVGSETTIVDQLTWQTWGRLR